MPVVVPFGLFVALTVPFFVNDVGFILAGSAAQWLAIDYGSKALVLAVVVLSPVLRRAVVAGSQWPTNGWTTVAATAGVTVATVGLFTWLDRSGADRATALQVFFPIEQPWLLVVDLAAGLALTAVVEEIVFRRLFIDTFAARLTPMGLYFISAALFAAIHWSSGIGTIGGAFVTGLLLMWLTQRSWSVLPAVSAHYFINVILFWP